MLPHDDQPDPRAFRIPAPRVSESVAYVLDTKGDSAVAMWGVPVPGQQPTTEELAEWVRSGASRKTIADHYDRTLSRVDDWLRLARRERPDLFPEARRGPKSQAPKTTTKERNQE